MSNTNSDQKFHPTPADLDQMEKDLLSVAAHGGWPFMIIDAFGIPFVVVSEHGYDDDLCPWYCASDRFVAVDEERHIHWMHPALEERISLLGAGDFYQKIRRDACIVGLTRRETAQTFDENAIEMLLRLKARQRVTDPIYSLLRSAMPLPSSQAAQSFLESTFKQAGLSDTLGWSLAQIALRVPSLDIFSRRPHENPSWQAAILSRLVDASLAPCPSQEDIRQSLIALAICDNTAPADLAFEVHCIANAMAHGAVPAAFETHGQQAVSDVDRTIARILRGDFDPKAVSPITPAEEKLVDAIARITSVNTGLAAHQKIQLLKAANDRLASLGYAANVDTAKIAERSTHLEEIPF